MHLPVSFLPETISLKFSKTCSPKIETKSDLKAAKELFSREDKKILFKFPAIPPSPKVVPRILAITWSLESSAFNGKRFRSFKKFMILTAFGFEPIECHHLTLPSGKFNSFEIFL